MEGLEILDDGGAHFSRLPRSPAYILRLLAEYTKTMTTILVVHYLSCLPIWNCGSFPYHSAFFTFCLAIFIELWFYPQEHGSKHDNISDSTIRFVHHSPQRHPFPTFDHIPFLIGLSLTNSHLFHILETKLSVQLPRALATGI